MDGTYRYPVYFDCPELDNEQIRKIETYFKIRRKSDGGDCGSLTRINEVYCIAFKDPADQQRVLNRPEHVLEFAAGPLVLTVRGSPGPHSSSPIDTSTQRQSLSPDSQSQQFTNTSSLPPTGEEYELQLDSYLLRYLHECPEAWEELEKELTTVGCSAQLFPERVLVRRSAQAAATDAVRNWKAQVDKLFEGYMVHYELDPHKVKALLQSCRFNQSTDEVKVKVYSEIGLAVVVGECSQVDARLKDVEDSTVRRRESRLSEKQTSVRHLGEAKLRLLWKDLDLSLRRDFPGVKVSQGEAGELILEGPVGEVLDAVNLISKKETLVLERTVSDICPYFLPFLKRTYGGPGVLGDFLAIGGKVEIELRDTELRFLSLSADKLDDAEKKFQKEFKDVSIDVPNCSVVPSELREKLKSKTNEMNQSQCRALAVFGSDSTVYLLGHTKEVEELTETVTQFVLDQAHIEGKIILPFQELVHLLPELLQLHSFDYSGVIFHPLTSSPRPIVVLEGPSNKVTEVRNRLGPLLDSLVQHRVIIDLPGAVGYFETPFGKQNLLSFAQSQKCLIQLQKQSHTTGHNSASAVTSYRLRGGIQVLVCHGDITKQDADALVNAANECLDHCGGVAAALSKAGGPEIQEESKTLVNNCGKIPTGDVVVTTGGNLKCKKLLHAVGPVGGKTGGRERSLLEKTVKSALQLAEDMGFTSIAMPCISSGIFGVPVVVCSEAIVTAVKEFDSQGGQSLRKIILIDNRGEVVRAMQDACDRLLRGTSTGNSSPSDLGVQVGAAGHDTARGAGAAGECVTVEVIQGTIETQQVDALVSPIVGHDPLSTRVGHAISSVVGPQMSQKFHKEAGATVPGDTVLVERLPGLPSKSVIFVNLAPWVNNQHENAVQVLRQGIRRILATCSIRVFRSVAFPVLGTGAVLRFPHSVASRVLLEEISVFEQNPAGRSHLLVRIVVHPNDKESSKALQSVQQNLHLRGFTNDVNQDQASFYRHVSTTNDAITAILGKVKLYMVHGDILNAGTDVIVNTTDFSNNPAGVSKAILTAAGPTVQAELARFGTPPDYMCTTGPGLLGCREIIHASFMSDPQVIQKNCKKILKMCEDRGYKSVAFPAINTGAAGMDPDKACKAMLDGMASTIRDLKPNSLSHIRIVILQQPVFQVFSTELENRLGQIAPRHNLKEKAKQKLKEWQEKFSRTSASSASEEKPLISSKPQPAALSVICCGLDIRTIKRDLEGILQNQLLEREVDVCDFSRLDDMELEAVLTKVKFLGISLEHRRRQIPQSATGNRARNAANAKATHWSVSGEEVYVLKGLKQDVLSVADLINRAVHKALRADIQDKKEAMLGLGVQWSIKDTNGTWQEMSLHANYMLEDAYMRKDVSVDVIPPDGVKVKVNLKTQEATNWTTGITYKVKRSASSATLEMPEHWEPMEEEEMFKKVEIQPNSLEYQTVAQGFLKTANFTIQKIECVQNVYLWYAYTVCRERILTKNGPAELGEKTLYHGTSASACMCIERDRFNRNFAGQHAAMYGNGVYFAVKAGYSASRFSPQDNSGLRRLYAVRVLTGRYTLGQSGMNAIPARGNDPTDCFDSLVDNVQNPSMFVIFHDDQAYPEYLITFK
ncbi:protein mono-ADP-ribosyltransferase PARP14-like [Mastacembelus armatus]|uniref:protein mono-ADP-ribosyltransferase PARP14-like n=1 Tax=Mastacembelus armatus TaxID=205130 RepID=UPI000E45CB9A|nr:protein mono-ADP-ribosyltransferase PARP14-like [Mastacembelus armatus]